MRIIYYKVTHKNKLVDHIGRLDIGIFSSLENAKNALEGLVLKHGFADTIEGFSTKKVFHFTEPKLLDRTFWVDEFDTCVWIKKEL